MSSGERWTTDEHLVAARERFAAMIPGYQPPAAYALARRGADGLVFGHVNKVGAARGLPAAALAVACGYSNSSGSFPLSSSVLNEVLERLSPAEAATHVPHPNIWTWRSLMKEAAVGDTFVAFYLANEADQPRTSEEAEFVALATGGG